MASSVTSIQSLAFPSNQASFAPWGQVSQIFTNLTRGFSQIGRDPGAKSISLGLSSDERDLIFSLDNGSVGRDLLGATLITSASRQIGPAEPGTFSKSYRLDRLSTTSGRLTVYQGPNLVCSTRLDTMI
jgi:hypothetical protein